MSSSTFLYDLGNASLDEDDNAAEAIRHYLNFQLLPYRPLSPPPFVRNPNAPLPTFECDQMYPGFESDDTDLDSYPHLPTSSCLLPLARHTEVDPGHNFTFDTPHWEPSFESNPLRIDSLVSEWSSPIPPLTAEPSSWKSIEDTAYSVSSSPVITEEVKERGEYSLDLLSESSGIRSTKSSSMQHSSASTPSGSALSTPDLTDKSASSSRASSLAPPRAPKKRSYPVDAAPNAAQPPTITSGYLCQWSQEIGGNCRQVCSLKQQHDRHILTHLLDVDGTGSKFYRCRICMAEKTQGQADKKGRKSTHSFTRKDPCIRHVKDQHANGQHFVTSDYIEEVPRPWSWPDELFLTPVFKGGASDAPSGETRNWRQYIDDIIRKYPDVVNKPRKKKEEDSDSEKDLNGSESDVRDEATRACKRRKVARK